MRRTMAEAGGWGDGCMLIDRDAERAALEREYVRDRASFVVVYGRRRIGKTALLVDFLKGKRGVYFLATEESEAQNRAAFAAAVGEFLDDDLIKHAAFDRWDDLFDRLTQGESQRTVIVIDEFQYLGKANGAFPSVLQRIWDTMLSGRNVMLVLCGSLISLMVEQTLAHGSPLYGRRTAQLHMKQLPFSCYGEFFPGEPSERRLVELFSVTGGVPKYIELFDAVGDIYESIAKNVLDRSSFLYDEPNFLLQREVGEVGSYFSIIKAIAAGNRKLGKMAAMLEAKQTSLTRYLKVLADLDIVEREVPVTDPNPQKSKSGQYRVKDNFLLFWFRYVFPSLGLIESGHADVVGERIARNFIDGHVAYVYERVCQEKVWDMAAEGAWPFVPTKVGRWWGAGDVEVDVVALDVQGGSLALCECKFWKEPVGANVLRGLEAKAPFVAWRNDSRNVSYVVFSISGFTEELRRLAAERDDVLLVG